MDNDFIAQIDEYFTRQQVVLSTHFRRLLSMRATLVELEGSFGSPAHQLDDFGRVAWACPDACELDSVLTQFDWSFKYDIAHCDELLYLLCFRAEAAIYHELAKRFQVRILHETKLTEAFFNRKVWNGIEPDLTVVKDTFLAMFGERSLKEQQLLDLRAYLRNRLFLQPRGFNGTVFSFMRVFRVSSWTLHVLQEDQHLLLQLIRLLRYSFSGDFEWEKLVSPESFQDFCVRLRKCVAIDVDSDYLKRLEIDDAGNFLLTFTSERQARFFSDIIDEIEKQSGMNIDF